MSIAETERLLIVDDDPHQLAALEAFFEQFDFRVRTARNAVDALSIYRSWLPGVAIFDIQMPGGGGRELSRAIRKLALEPLPFLIALSGLSSLSEPARSFDAGFDRHFIKPTHLPLLYSAIWSRNKHS